MARRSKLPLVAICGRPNVGKSTLFNRIVGRQSAIVHDEAGVTRDRAYGVADWDGRKFRVVDTGGIVENATDPVTSKMQEQVKAALDEANVIVFVIDGQQVLTKGDFDIRDNLFKYSKPIIIAANKLDNAKLRENRTEFYELGLGDPIATSSGHGLGIEELVDAVTALLPERVEVSEEAEERKVTRVAVLGKPNVGKSSYINAILNEERNIVDDVPGTTRDAIDIEFKWKEKEYLFIDTAGLRKKAGIHKDVERFSVARSLRAVRRADVCLVLMNANEGITEQDKRIVSYIVEQGRAMILVWTKWDLVEDKERRFKDLADEIEFKAPFLKHVPSVTISNVTRQRVFTVFEYIDRVAVDAEKRIPTHELNVFIEKVRTNQAPAMHHGKIARIKYATQVSARPTVFVLFVNRKNFFHFSYLRHIENQLREQYGFEGVPITIELREGERKEKDEGE
ncbi:MAG: ribosome biogenesis GTPase Der [Candidatus Hydrogenedentes bacterium]|nr:ribosome biogenesis GTPase Der [Candidatus Hydrogenedentota bacterium]